MLSAYGWSWISGKAKTGLRKRSDTIHILTYRYIVLFTTKKILYLRYQYLRFLQPFDQTMSVHQFSFTATIRLRSTNKAPWHFITLPTDIAEEISQLQNHVEKRRGRWAVKVEAHIGFVKWKTSIFPSKEFWSYILPIKKDVRDELNIGEWDEITLLLSLA